MLDTNEKVLKSYNENIERYIDKTPQRLSDGCKAWIDRSLEGLPKRAKIIEIGSASGLDADYIEGKGYTVKRTDGAKGFVYLLRSKGYGAEIFDLIKDEFYGKFDLIYANAVLVHFKSSDVKNVLIKIYNSLEKDGVFSFNLKEGRGQEWLQDKLEAPRFYKF